MNLSSRYVLLYPLCSHLVSLVSGVWDVSRKSANISKLRQIVDVRDCENASMPDSARRPKTLRIVVWMDDRCKVFNAAVGMLNGVKWLSLPGIDAIMS